MAAKKKKKAAKPAPKKAKSKTTAKKVQAKAKVRAKVAPKSVTKAPAKPKRTAVPKGASLLPLADRVLIALIGASETTAGGIIIPGTVSERPNRGEVLAVGSGRRGKKGGVRPLDVRVGDTVLFPKYAGSEVAIDGQEYLLLREEEVLGILD